MSAIRKNWMAAYLAGALLAVVVFSACVFVTS